MEKPGKMSTRQFMLLFVMVVLSPCIRVFAIFVGTKSKQASWITPIPSLFIFLLFLYILHLIIRKNQDKNLGDLCLEIFTKPVGIVILIVYFVWAVLLLGLYLRYYAERILTAVMPDYSIEFIVIIMLLLVFLTLRSGIMTLARFNEVLFAIFIVIFFIITLFAVIEKTQIKFLMPVTHYDILPILNGTRPVMSIWGYITFMFFFFDVVNHKNDVFKTGKKFAILVCIIAFLVIVSTIGTIGYYATNKVSLPYFNAVKDLHFLTPMERFDAILFSLWVVADFANIAVFAYISVSLLKTILNLPKRKEFLSPVVLLGFTLCFALAKSRFELETFTNLIGLDVNYILCLALPVSLLVVGKIRKKI